MILRPRRPKPHKPRKPKEKKPHPAIFAEAKPEKGPHDEHGVGPAYVGRRVKGG